VAVYLMRYLRGDSLEEIGREFRIATYSSVSSVIERTKAMIVKDRVLRHRVEELKKRDIHESRADPTIRSFNPHFNNDYSLTKQQLYSRRLDHSAKILSV